MNAFEREDNNVDSLINYTSNIKSSFQTPTPSNFRTISGSAASSGIGPFCNFVGNFTVLVVVVCGRRDAEVAGRASMRCVEADATRNVEPVRPVAVAGRVGGLISGILFDGAAVGVGTTRTGCPRFRGAGCFGGCGTVMVAARFRDTDAPCAAFATCPMRWAVGSTLARSLEASAPRCPAKGLGSSVNDKPGSVKHQIRQLAVFCEFKEVPLRRRRV